MVVTAERVPWAAFFAGALVGTLGGMIGLGGAEFRLPLLIAIFGFVALEAIILNKAISLVVVASALLFRLQVFPLAALLEHWPIVANLLAGSLIGAWLGASVAIRLASRTLYQVISVLLLLIAIVLLLGHEESRNAGPLLFGPLQVVAGVAAGLAIGIVASLLGVAGGEFLIPTLILLFGVDIKMAGSLSLAISLPTMIVGFARYSRERSFSVLAQRKGFVWLMAVGSIAGAFIGSQLLRVVSSAVLLPLLALILVVSAVKLWRRT
ncbi:MAG TPA: sulfite exporter TauE/SafE family protein [Steroidobacteraceae bacterium]|nr:sulfite exporter TauE/SafE family protein [Steroidobacteraceae bacterium]